MADPMEPVREFCAESAQIIKETYITPTTDMVSQSFGRLLIEHARLAIILPDYLQGCIDAILVDSLYHLHRCAMFERDRNKVTNDELTGLILGEMVQMRGEMSKRRNSKPAETPCSCGKKGSCQSPIMEA